MDLYEDGFPHGTKAGYERGCKGGACPNAFEGLTICRDAFMRYNRDYAYRKAVDAGETPPPEFPAKAAASKAPRGEVRVFAEPTVTVADSVEPLPEAAPAKRVRTSSDAVVHPSNAMYQRGCRKDNECPSFLEGGLSCRQASVAYKRGLVEAKRAAQQAAEDTPSVPATSSSPDVVVTPERAGHPEQPTPELTLAGATSHPDLECTVTALPSGALVVVIRIPASVVAA
ncbi:hypothetical protein [Herbiconiux sp.]|uniref:hypothetical protein n=1 Tax=Herbiconiux sp. TaxID=1871186 RepID=UPI0025B8A9B6|nr:hypothetical protein [Herbiconiux sp.]